MKAIIALGFLVAGIAAITNPPIKGQTPASVSCGQNMCKGRDDGNYNYPGKDNYFVQCSGGASACQACWPLSLKFKQDCNQCVYDLADPCYTTETWAPIKRYACPDICPSMGHEYRGNMADPGESKHYVGCWDGVTRGCVPCPADLEFNEKENACLYEGKYLTKPLKH